MGTLAPLSRMCAFTYTVPPLAEVHMPHSHTGSKGYPKGCPKVLAQVPKGTPHSLVMCQNLPKLPTGRRMGPTARYPAKFGLKRVPRDPLGPNLSIFLFTHGQRGINMSQTGVHVGPGGSKWHQHGLKWAQKRLKRVKSGQKRPLGPPNGPKCTFPRPKSPKAWRFFFPLVVFFRFFTIDEV